ncbi:MAG: SWIM zinc finger family protein [Saprospiraceae bacterium]
MNPHVFLQLAKPDELHKSLNFLDDEEVALSTDRTSTGLRATAQVGRKSSHQVVAKFDPAGALTQIKCSCRRAQLDRPCAHSLALVTQVLSEQLLSISYFPKTEVNALPKPEDIKSAEDIPDEVLLAHVANTQGEIADLRKKVTKLNSTKWRNLHKSLLDGLTLLSHKALEAYDQGNQPVAFVSALTILMELSYVSFDLWETMPEMAELTLLTQRVYLLSYMEMGDSDRTQLYPMVTTAYTHLVHRSAVSKDVYMIDPAHYLFIIGNSDFDSNSLNWLHAQSLEQLPRLLRARPGLANGLVKAVAGGLLRHAKLDEAIALTKMGKDAREIAEGVRMSLKGQGVDADFERYMATFS